MEWNEKQKSKLQLLLESFDKRFVEEIFEELQKIKTIPPNERDNLVYNYNGFRYFLWRVDLRQIPMSHGGLKLG